MRAFSLLLSIFFLATAHCSYNGYLGLSGDEPSMLEWSFRKNKKGKGKKSSSKSGGVWSKLRGKKRKSDDQDSDEPPKKKKRLGLFKRSKSKKNRRDDDDDSPDSRRGSVFARYGPKNRNDHVRDRHHKDVTDELQEQIRHDQHEPPSLSDVVVGGLTSISNDRH
ncbi:tudor domain-containing protein 15 isoform X1, putative [Babesia ovis]|uniref:Tudor domain-containing protein 15 isoform X1, putative n=1 Tax=Babesia ovis TaxID=5869 RepID=A0A9W5T7Y1_BABOV|nr:tudor domain-containing protein 15 isoform X1, putative [Babesia ovis]